MIGWDTNRAAKKNKIDYKNVPIDLSIVKLKFRLLTLVIILIDIIYFGFPQPVQRKENRFVAALVLRACVRRACVRTGVKISQLITIYI